MKTAKTNLKRKVPPPLTDAETAKLCGRCLTHIHPKQSYEPVWKSHPRDRLYSTPWRYVQYHARCWRIVRQEWARDYNLDIKRIKYSVFPFEFCGQQILPNPAPRDSAAVTEGVASSSSGSGAASSSSGSVSGGANAVTVGIGSRPLISSRISCVRCTRSSSGY